MAGRRSVTVLTAAASDEQTELDTKRRRPRDTLNRTIDCADDHTYTQSPPRRAHLCQLIAYK